MQLYFIRHGQSANNALWAHTGSSDGRNEDPELTTIGQRQTQRLAQFLCQRRSPTAAGEYDPKNVGGFDITHIYCSPMIRAVTTGTCIAEALDLPLVVWPDLHEVGGIFLNDAETGAPVGLPGRNRAYFETHYPDLILPDFWGEGGWWKRPFEEREHRLPRARRVLHDLLERHGPTDDRVILVSHGGLHSYLLAAILGLDKRDTLWFSMNNAAITRVDLADQQVALVYTNRTDFLPDELIT